MLDLQKQRVFGLEGDREGSNVISLPPLFSPEGSVNVRQSKAGLIEVVKGYAKLNSSAVTADTSADAVACTGVTQYVTVLADVVTRHLIAVFDDGDDECEIWKSTDSGANWTFLSDLGSAYVGTTPYFAQYKDTLIITFGKSLTPKKYDGSTIADAGSTQPATPSAAASSTTGLLNGKYRYKVAIIDSDGDVGPASAASTPVVVENLRVDLSSIATGAGSPKGRRIFRTFGDGNEFYRLADIDNNTDTTFEDNISDEELADRAPLIEDDGDPPPDGSHYPVQHRSRVFYRVDSNQIGYSSIGVPDSVDLLNFEKVGEGEQGDYLTGLIGEIEGELIIPKQRSIWRLSGASRRSFNMIRSQASLGFVSSRAVTEAPAGASWRGPDGEMRTINRPALVGIAPDKSVQIFDGFTNQPISWDKVDTLATMSHQNRAKSVCFNYGPYGWIVWGFPSASGSGNVDTWIAWDWARGSWHEVDSFPEIAGLATGDFSNEGDVVFAGEARTATGGFVYQLFSGNSAAGSNITPKVRTVPLHFGQPELDKYLHSIEPIFEAAASSLTITMKIYTGFASTGATAFVTKTFDIQGSNVNFVSPDPIEIKDSNGEYPRSQAFVIEFTTTGTTPWALAGWTAWYQVEPARRV